MGIVLPFTGYYRPPPTLFDELAEHIIEEATGLVTEQDLTAVNDAELTRASIAAALGYSVQAVRKMEGRLLPSAKRRGRRCFFNAAEVVNQVWVDSCREASGWFRNPRLAHMYAANLALALAHAVHDGRYEDAIRLRIKCRPC